jgi:hypothetical protein
MFVSLAKHDGPVLLDALNFRALKVEAPSELDDKDIADGLTALGTRDGDHAWLSISDLKALGPDEPSWKSGFDAMIAFAERAGWVSADKSAVRAHIERKVA